MVLAASRDPHRPWSLPTFLSILHMPIIRCRNRNIYFSHTPKCGGSSIEAYLQQFDQVHVALLDPAFYLKDEYMRVGRSSPQHIPGILIWQLFPAGFFDAFFSIVRNPIDRFRSAFIFHKYVTKMIDADADINDFIERIDSNRALKNGNFDNHFPPQALFLYPKAKYTIFRFEDGLEKVKEFLDVVVLQSGQGQAMPHMNKSSVPEAEQEKVNISASSGQILMDRYKIDYELFGY